MVNTPDFHHKLLQVNTLLVTVYLLRFVYIYVSQIRHFKAWIVYVASVSVLFPSKDRAKNGPSPLFHFLALVSFLARPKPRISFLGLSLLRNSTETLATQAKAWIKDHLSKEARFIPDKSDYKNATGTKFGSSSLTRFSVDGIVSSNKDS